MTLTSNTDTERPRLMHTAPQFIRISLLAALALALSACGSGDSIPDFNGSSTSTSSLTQGRWVTAGITPAYVAYVLPAPTGASTPAVDTLWALAEDASTLIKLKVNGVVQTPGAVTGNVYTLGTSSVNAVSGGSYIFQAAATGHQMSLQPVLGTTVLFNRSDAMGTALKAEQANGKWQADLGPIKVNWTVDTAATNVKNLSGTSTTGCSYSGQSTVVPTQSLYVVQFTETCPGNGTPVTQSFSGIGSLNADSTRLTVVATNEAETRAAALQLVKQP